MDKKVILITGASSGIGKAAALQLLDEGHIVYGAARRVEKMEDIKSAGGHAIEMDITKDEDVINAVNRIIGEQHRVDVLVNNAGYAIYGAVEDTDIDDARRQFEVNLFGLARITQLVLPYMRSQQSGKIINMSSMGGKVYTPLGAWYHATKHALEGWSDSLRLEVKQFGIDVVIVEPGIIATEFGEVMDDPMMKRSGEGPYSNMAEFMSKATRKSYEEGNASPPSVIADVISKAVNSDKPKIRYVKGKLAKPVMLMRKILGDRIFDKLILKPIK